MRVPRYVIEEFPHLSAEDRHLSDVRAMSGAIWFFYNMKTKRAYTRKMNLFSYHARVHDCYYDNCLAFRLHNGVFRLVLASNMNMKPLEFTYGIAVSNVIDTVAMGNAVDSFFQDKEDFVTEYLEKEPYYRV